MKQYTLHTKHKKLLADTLTPVSIYLKLRDHFPGTLLLESSDYHSREDSFSYICCQPIASFSANKGKVMQQFPDGTTNQQEISTENTLPNLLQNFASAFKAEDNDFKFVNNGLFGYTAYDSVQYFEDVEITAESKAHKTIPELQYHVFRFIIAIDHFKNELHIFEHNYEEEGASKSIETIESLINNRNFASYGFESTEEEKSNFTDEEYLEVVEKGKQHCQRGDVFQIVLSREFNRKFQGDEFNVYRALRAVNPSPYLFYFDYGSFKIFGSSPEAQITVRNEVATINPIAGTYKRTGNEADDVKQAQLLKKDPKENAEHVMLVDLARNDLSRNAKNVEVDTFSEIQYYSHVIHMVSKVTGKLKQASSTAQIVADTFPAGTLSGAPKHRAMQLIDKYEKGNRSFYGGAIGFMGFDGDFNHAIMIRSFLSKNNTLTYQAGAGIVAASQPKSELQEVNNKIAALRKAIKKAEQIAR